jgi:hypothetical protein
MHRHGERGPLRRHHGRAASFAEGRADTLKKQLDSEKGQTQYIHINEDLKRLEVRTPRLLSSTCTMRKARFGGPFCLRERFVSVSPLLQQSCGVIVGQRYPAPIVDEKEALAHAREQLTAARRRLRTDDAARAETAALLKRHGSRRPPRQRAALGRSPGSRATSAVTSAAMTSGAHGQQSLFSFREVVLEDDARDTDDVHDDVDDDMP